VTPTPNLEFMNLRKIWSIVLPSEIFGYAPHLRTLVWRGFKDHSPIPQCQGVTTEGIDRFAARTLTSPTCLA
jgi:hypothetical protein